MMSHDQYLSQVRSADLAQLEESDISPMILRSLVAGRSFARLPFLCPLHPLVQTHAKERMFLHGILDTKGVTNRQGPAMTQQFNVNHGELIFPMVHYEPVSFYQPLRGIGVKHLT